MKRLCLILVFCILCVGRAEGVVRSLLKVDCMPELGIFEIHVLKFDQIYSDHVRSFLDKADFSDSEEYRLLRDKYNLVYEYEYRRDVPRREDDNYTQTVCDLAGARYKINIFNLGTTIEKDDKKIAEHLFFASAWNEWTIESLVFDAKNEVFLIGGQFAFGLPLLYFSYSTKGGAVLTEDVIKQKGEVFYEELVHDGKIDFSGAMSPLVIQRELYDQ